MSTRQLADRRGVRKERTRAESCTPLLKAMTSTLTAGEGVPEPDIVEFPVPLAPLPGWPGVDPPMPEPDVADPHPEPEPEPEPVRQEP
jgi:hypothetical protein